MTTGGLSAGGGWVCGAHGGRSTRYIAPAPSKTPMTSPIEPRTASLYHASRAAAVEPRIAVGITLAAVGSYLLAGMGLGGARLRFFAAGVAVGATAWYLNAALVDWLFAKLALPREQAINLQK